MGGGVYGGPGGAFTVSNCSFLRNQAGAVGGGLGFGTSFGSSLDTCALQLIDGNMIGGNTAVHGSAQVHMDCIADMLVSDTNVLLSSGSSQVRRSVFFIHSSFGLSLTDGIVATSAHYLC